MNETTKNATRRNLLRLGGAGLALHALMPGAARAADLKGKTVVFASWGGAYQDAERVSYCVPFSQQTGARVVQDGPMDVAKFRTMAEGGAPNWDVVDITIDFLYAGQRDNLFEKIDKTVVDTSRIDPKFVDDYGIGCIVWSYNLGYNSGQFASGAEPAGWADLFDLKRFPGKRMLSDNPVSTFEIALLADGVAPKDLYPLDVSRALKKLDTIKAQTVFWSTNSQSQQLLVDREVNLGMILNGRAYDAAKKGAPIAVSWKQNIQSVDYLVVPRGSQQREAAMALINVMTEPANQAKLANLIAYSPTNPAAIAGTDSAIRPWLCTTPENAAEGFVIDAAYWRDNLQANRERWSAWKLS
jgi:putative spermidine/putrescine transport system substrate-binding protein